MSLSTSSFKIEIKVIGMVLLALAACELGVRIFERRLSVDAKIPALSKRLVEGEGQLVLVLGNSLVRDGVNVDILEAEMRAQGVAPIHIERTYMMNTIINDWYYAFKHHFVDTGRLPGALVLCFSNNHLEDASIQRPLVARYYSSPRDIPQIFSEDVPDFDGRIDFLLSVGSASFTHRTNVGRRILDTLIPHYRASAMRINNALTDEARKRSLGYQPTYHRLEEFLRMAAGHGVRVVLVAMPVESLYQINPQIKRTAEATGATFIDSRLAEGLSEESYSDGMHMTSSGAAIYSRSLARQLADYFKRTPREANSE
jgi:hypothetical protein